MDFKVIPLYDQVFVKKDEEATTASGLHLTQSVKGRAVTGTVVAAGPGMLSPYTGGYLPMTVKKGQRVFLREFSGYVIRHEGQEVHVFKENEIIGIVKE